MIFDITKLRSEIILDEGHKMRNGLHVPYYDHLGYETIGYGTLIDAQKGGGLYEEEAIFILEHRLTKICIVLNDKFEWFEDLTEGRKRALCNMAYQLGISGLLKFKKMLAALAGGDYEKAFEEALDSKWAGQTPVRAGRVAKLLKEGE